MPLSPPVGVRSRQPEILSPFPRITKAALRAIYAGIFAAAAVVGAWVLKEVHERSVPIPPPSVLQVPLPPADWNAAVPAKLPPQTTPALPNASMAPRPLAMTAKRAALEKRRAEIETELKRNSAELNSLKALGENQTRQADLAKRSADMKEQLDSIEKRLSAH